MPVNQCEICGKAFYTKTTAKFCSDDCKRKNKSKINQLFHKKNKEKVNQRAKERYRENPDWFKERDRKGHEKEIKKRELMGEIVRKRTKLSNLSKEERKQAETKIRDRRNKLRRQQYNEDSLFSMKNRIRSLLNKRLRDNDLSKSKSTEHYLGCDMQTFMKHLESNFSDGMNWENRDKWHIDHIVPISRAKTEEEFILLSHYTNLHPMWADKNIKKSNKIGFHNVTGKMIKKYGQKGEYQQYRYEKIVDFNCFLCGKEKKAKLVIVYEEDWNKIICNGCYGNRLSK